VALIFIARGWRTWVFHQFFLDINISISLLYGMNWDLLWDKIQKGDQASFKILYQEYYPILCYYANRLLNDHFLAEEVVQDIFVRVWEMRSGIFSQGNSLKTYLYRSVHTRCLNLLKHQKTRKASMIRHFSSEAWISIAENYGFDEFLIEKIDSEDMEETLEKMIEELPAQCRDIFRKSRMDNMTNEEIAEQTGISINTVRTQIYRALQKLKKGLYLIATLLFA
jgi:RNA polymerase sigma-70 factor (ECF subfamily)